MTQTHTADAATEALSDSEMKQRLRSPLKLAENQPSRWQDYPGDGVDFFTAANAILEADAADGARQDVGIARLDSWAFGPAPDATAALATIPEPGREHRMVPLRAHAFSQLCQRVGVPVSYVKKLPGRLQIALLNHGIQNESSDNANLLRLADGECRAVLTDKYAPFDNHVVVDVLSETLQKAGMLHDVRVRSVSFGPTASMRLTIPGSDVVLDNPNKVGDIVEVGLDLLNGELGNRSVSVGPVTWRLVCLNGMRRADRSAVTRISHVGDTERLRESFRDGVPSALAAAQGMGDTMQQALDVMVDDLLNEFDGLASAFGLHKAEVKDVAADVLAERQIALPSDTSDWADAFARAGEVTAFDVANGITHVAQSRPTDRRLEMEEGAYAYLQRRTR